VDTARQNAREGSQRVVMTGRFEEFAARKTRQAIAAALPPYVTDFDARPGGMLAIDDRWSTPLFDGPFYLSPSRDRRTAACSLVFVQSLDGNTGGRDPQALGGGETDKHLIYEGLSRVAADGVLAGAETIRGGRIVFSVWHPELVRLRASLGKARHPVQIVATRRGVPIDRELIYNVPRIPVVLLTVGSCAASMRDALAARPWITPVVMDRPDQLAAGFERLRTLGIERISCVGGRNLATQLIDAGLVQDVYLTTSPRAGGDPNTPMYPRPVEGRVVVRKQGTSEESGVVFEHVVLHDRSGRAPGFLPGETHH
jgi:5-amino-6-(5-phosphoribosylamino)uracil reductase